MAAGTSCIVRPFAGCRAPDIHRSLHTRASTHALPVPASAEALCLGLGTI